MKKELLKELSCYGAKVKVFKHSKGAYVFVTKSYPKLSPDKFNYNVF